MNMRFNPLAATRRPESSRLSPEAWLAKLRASLHQRPVIADPQPTCVISLDGDAIDVDLFCGGGGASEGIRAALGVSPGAAVNHNEHAIRMHEANHPATRHYRTSVYEVDPVKVVAGRRMRLLWASPDCKHFSRAKGGQLKDQGIRSLAWVVSNPGKHISGVDCVGWIQSVAPEVVCLENVPEFEEWGPLYDHCSCGALEHGRAKHSKHCHYGKVVKHRRGETFKLFVQSMRDAGYSVSWRSLVAADYGAPTTRKRLFLVARRDGMPVQWPIPTHSKPHWVHTEDGRRKAIASIGNTEPWRPAASIIDWSVPSLSIFADSAEAKAWARATGQGVPRRPLADATQRRIAEGIRRYVLDPKRRPFLVKMGDELGAQAMVQTGYGERKGQAPRCLDLTNPLGTIVAQGNKHAVVTAFLAQHNLGMVGNSLHRPLPTVTGVDTKSLVTADLELPGDENLGRARMVAAFLIKYYGQFGAQSPLDTLHTVRAGDTFALVYVDIDSVKYVITDIAMRMLTPRELANAQGFSPNYVLMGTKKEQIARIGNSVCPDMARAIVSEQFPNISKKEVA